MSNKGNDELQIEKIEEIDAEQIAADIERDSKVKEERGKLYELSVLPANTKIVAAVAVFALLALGFVLISVLSFSQDLFVTALVLMCLTGIAVLLQREPFYADFAVALLTIIAGFVLHVPAFMVLAALVYLAAATVIYLSELWRATPDE